MKIEDTDGLPLWRYLQLLPKHTPRWHTWPWTVKA